MGACYGLQVSGNTAFVGRGNGLEIIDVSNPSNPVVSPKMPEVNAGVIEPVIYRNGILHVQGYLGSDYSTDGIHRIDVSSLTQPVVAPVRVDLARKVGNHYGQIKRAETYERWGLSSQRWQPA